MNSEIRKLLYVRYYMQDVQVVEEKVRWQKERIRNITQHISNMPSGGGIAGGIEHTLAKLDELEGEQRQMLECYTQAMRDAEGILRTIRQDELRTFVRLTYVEQLPPETVRNALRWGEKRMRRMKHRIQIAERLAEVEMGQEKKMVDLPGVDMV